MGQSKLILMHLSVIFFGTCITYLSYAPTAVAQPPTLEDPVDVHRAEWHARPPTRGKGAVETYQERGYAQPPKQTIIFHSTDMGPGTGEAEAQKIQNKQMNEMGFGDIGYNFLIDSNGTIFEGRELFYVPSHAGRTVEADAEHDIAKDPDFGTIGVAFSSGQDSSGHMHKISEQQIAAAKKLVAFFVQHPRFRVNKVITHAEVAPELKAEGLTPNEGDFNPHVCPGTQNLDAIIGLRNELKRELGIPFDERSFRNLYDYYQHVPHRAHTTDTNW